MPKTRVSLEVEIDHPEKCSNNVLIGVDMEQIAGAIAGATGAASVQVASAKSIPCEEGITAQVAEKKEYPA